MTISAECRGVKVSIRSPVLDWHASPRSVERHVLPTTLHWPNGSVDHTHSPVRSGPSRTMIGRRGRNEAVVCRAPTASRSRPSALSMTTSHRSDLVSKRDHTASTRSAKPGPMPAPGTPSASASRRKSLSRVDASEPSIQNVATPSWPARQADSRAIAVFPQPPSP
jgi:hypothetical protein